EDLADPGAGFSELLNKQMDAMPAAIRTRVVAELNNDPTLLQAALDMLDSAIADVGLARTFLGKNLFDPATRIIGYVLDSTGGTVALAGYSVTDYISVRAGQAVTLNAPRHVVLYDASKVFVPGSRVDNPGQGPVTVTPAADGFVRASVSDANLPTFQ